MPVIEFRPGLEKVEVPENTKLLVAGRKAGVEIRFGCGACQCASCAVKILAGQESLIPMKQNEIDLLKRVGLPTSGEIRLSCQARICGDHCIVDLSFQDMYSPDKGLDQDT